MQHAQRRKAWAVWATAHGLAVQRASRLTVKNKFVWKIHGDVITNSLSPLLLDVCDSGNCPVPSALGSKAQGIFTVGTTGADVDEGLAKYTLPTLSLGLAPPLSTRSMSTRARKAILSNYKCSRCPGIQPEMFGLQAIHAHPARVGAAKDHSYQCRTTRETNGLRTFRGAD
ncbi:hypothetical protein EVAR_86094_1 [Eumeta japonica]|uniref:Uncharacterized protein n=1 Tax=Eumeta variegata TaxID=151549 RepID=A0A4C1V1U8_EUMVA|nr:hypothetical protein EVAR_86094_1 [Eumeta japonica]